MNSPLTAPAPLPSTVLPEGLAALCTSAASPETPTIGSLYSPRPFAPLSKSFRINTVTNSPQNAPLSNSFRFNHFQTSCKAPLSKPFRIIALQKGGGWGSDGVRTFNFRQSNIPLTPNVFYHLRKTSRRPQKRPQCFLSLTDLLSRNLLCFLSVTKKGGGGGLNFCLLPCFLASLPPLLFTCSARGDITHCSLRGPLYNPARLNSQSKRGIT
jgi:hypothetical protein